ncbi:MAG: hypothetical protein GTO14_14305 [Anaerolineales bacterium]|nr:hypothetical protein [Anaerolineales bacterium]
MFLERSRYYKVQKAEIELKNGRTVKVVRLRRLPDVQGSATVVKENDRLDIYAQRHYNDPTRFWHIADANSELKANDLVSKPGRTIEVPET